MKHQIRGWRRSIITVTLASTVAACGGGKSADEPKTEQPRRAQVNGASDSAKSSQDWKPAIRTASVPSNPCDWMPVADVEAVIGKLAEPPTKDDGCRYTLVLPEAVVAKRQKALDMQQKIQQAFGQPAPEFAGSMANTDKDPRSYAVVVKVDVNAGVEGERAGAAIAKSFGMSGETDQDKAGDVKAPTDWDDARRSPYGFSGRIGHVRVNVDGQSPDVPAEPVQLLAARVRDRIPDLPFPVTNPYQVMQLGSTPDPCTLLSRTEAESILGPLAMDPYRSSSYWPPLAHGQGYACAYFTPGHHVLALSPTWQGGAELFKLEKGVGGLVGLVAPQEAVVIKGPWDQAFTGAGSGAMLFLKGDRLLEVHYRTSRATRADAIKLAAMAMQRLAP